jgi:hypothetical protein
MICGSRDAEDKEAWKLEREKAPASKRHVEDDKLSISTGEEHVKHKFVV